MTIASPAVQATRFLHVNMNTDPVDVTANWYREVLGMRVGMRSRSHVTDAAGMGFDQPIEVDACFAYDHRGGRRSQALELVQWVEPVVIGSPYADPAAVGMQAVGFRVPPALIPEDPSLLTGERLLTLGGDPLVDAVTRDPEGVRVELITDHEVTAPVFGHVRMNCADLEQTLSWYESIGFTRQNGRRAATWRKNDGTSRNVLVQAVRLPSGADFVLELTVSVPATAGRAHSRANTRGLFRMALAVEDVHEAVRSARANADIEASNPSWVPLPGTPRGGIWASFFTDPDGVMVEFVGLPEADLEK